MADLKQLAQDMIPDATFNDYLCTGIVLVLQNAIGEESFLPRLLVLEAADETNTHPASLLLLAFDGFNDPDIRHQALFHLGQQAYRNTIQPVAAFLLSEAWGRYFKTDEACNLPLADYEDKVEVLLAMGLTLDKRAAHAYFPITRDDNNLITSIGNPTLFPYGSTDTIDSPLVAQFFRGYLAALKKNQGTLS